MRTLSRLSVPGKIVIGTGFTLLIVGIAAIVFLTHLVRKSTPVTDGTLSLAGLHSPVDVYRDQFGIPHISARDEHDLMMATGFVQAQDRLWQMDLMRRAGEGRLSEIISDSSVLSLDCLFRTIGLREIAMKMKDSLHPASRSLLEDYTAGVNAFIESNRGKYPVEFDMLNYQPEPWHVEESLVMARLLAWELNLSWWTDLTYGEISTTVSSAKLAEILPGYADSLPVTVPSRMMKKAMSGLDEVMKARSQYDGIFGLSTLSGGSNAWVVDSTRSMSGKPILANDPHLAMPAPSRWYEMHLSAPGWNVSGVSLPGLPLIVIGHNDHIAWGMTNAMIDDADFYVEKTDSLQPEYYRLKQGLQKFSEREEKIYIGSHDSLVMTVRSTIHGPVINDVHPMLKKNAGESGVRPPVTMRWTGSEVSDDIYGIYLINTAVDRKRFVDGLREITVPAQEVLYADVDGTIACWTAGRVPVRGKFNSLLPLPGWSGETEWQGFIPFDQLPAIINPPEGFIACANQKLADKTYPYYLSSLWEPPSRIHRIRELLSGSVKFSADDFKQFQQDVYSDHAKELASVILAAFEGGNVADPLIKSGLTYLRNWDYRYTSSDIASTITSSFFTRLLHNTFEDQMGPKIFGQFVFFNAIPYRVTSQLFASDTSLWWDDIRTPERETKNDIVRKSFSEGIHELASQIGPDMKTWRWGTLHTVTFNHPFGKRPPLDKIFDIGPFPIGGGGTTIVKTEFNFTHPYAVTVGPSMRFVVDLAEPLDASIIITSGESGQPFNHHYNDQTPLWLNGGYVSTTMDLRETGKGGWEHLRLEP